MPINISSVQCKLIGISCLSGDERQKVQKEWESRLSGYDSLWVDAKQNQTALDLIKNITELAREKEFEIMGGQSVLVSVFLDLTKSPDEALLKEIVAVPKELSRILGCVVPLTLEFGYLAMFAFGDREALKANIRKVVDINIQDKTRRKQLCFVGTSPAWNQDEDVCWKPVMVCLDLLRRNSSPAAMVPVEGLDACNNIGFLRYGEYDEDRLHRLHAEKERTECALGDDGSLAFMSELSAALEKIENDVVEKYPVDGKNQPIHPEMFPKGFIETMKAKKGQPPFATARTCTLQALKATADSLKHSIFDDYRKQIASAPDYLKKFIENSRMGIGLESDRKKMEELLAPQPLNVMEPLYPALNYNESGYEMEMDSYLKNVRRFAGAKCRYDFAKALLEAYRQIPDEEYIRRKEKLQKENTTVRNQISRLSTREDLIGKITAGDVLPKTAFTVTLAAGHSAYWALTRDMEIGMELDKATAGLMATAYYIDPKFGGLNVRDNAPLKALQLLQFNCNEAILENLIG